MLEEHARLGLVTDPVNERDMPQWVPQTARPYARKPVEDCKLKDAR